MEATFTTTVDDVVAYLARAFWQNRNARTYYLALWLMIPLGCFLGAGLLLKRGAPGFAPVLLVLLGVIHLVAAPRIFWKRFRQSARQTAGELPAGLLGTTTLILNDDALTHVTAASRVEIPWSGVEGVEESGGCTFISVGGALPLLVPERGFVSPVDYRAVREFILSRAGKGG